MEDLHLSLKKKEVDKVHLYQVTDVATFSLHRLPGSALKVCMGDEWLSQTIMGLKDSHFRCGYIHQGVLHVEAHHPHQ